MTKSIADTIHDAIENHLWDGETLDSDDCIPPWKFMFSCDAARFSYDGRIRIFSQSNVPVETFLLDLGWPMLCEGFDGWSNKKAQYARALALTFAALIAKEEGI